MKTKAYRNISFTYVFRMLIRYFVEPPLALICFLYYWGHFCQFCTPCFGQFIHPFSQAWPDWMWTLCELRDLGFFTDFPVQFPGFGSATQGHSETCSEATCFGCVLCVPAMLKGELLAQCEFGCAMEQVFLQGPYLSQFPDA